MPYCRGISEELCVEQKCATHANDEERENIDGAEEGDGGDGGVAHAAELGGVSAVGAGEGGL